MDDKLGKDTAKAMAYLRAKCAVDGAASLNFKDGEIFMFSRKTIEELKRRIDENGADEAIVYVQHGGILQDA